jgi:hypothetical protein
MTPLKDASSPAIIRANQELAVGIFGNPTSVALACSHYVSDYL